MSRFVRPLTRTLTLANGDQLIVRERLTAGEQRAGRSRLYRPGASGRLEFDPLLSNVALVITYLLDWNLKDDQDQLVAIRDLSADDLQRVIDSLDTESFREIHEAIEAHDVAMLEARTQKKTTPTGEAVS